MYVKSRVPGILTIIPVRRAMMKKVEMELATITIGRYSTPYLLRKVVSAKLVKTMLELRMRKKRTAHHRNIPTSSW
jgi:hypothetical protein